ncbi:MAG TPA: amino acid ABC transporter permease [bacterium]|jgi:His/Glu/Gln/Arg/opine family amino acid ABC transporter permease subunit|nr:amino acid ABC transporter permease [bacterium]
MPPDPPDPASGVLTEAPGRGRLLPADALQRIPWWALLLVIGGLLALYGILNSPVYIETYRFLAAGVLVTLKLAVLAYALAMVLGLIAALAQLSKNPIPFTISRLYIEIIRGVPLLVQLLYIAFVVTPALAELTGIRWLRNDIVRATLGLGIGYGAYLAEVYRAGILSIPRGQTEAARSLGMTYWQSMRHIVLPQAVRVILPPLGNDFISMLKDSSLASVISVQELTYSGSLLNARTFRSFQTYNMVALLYLMMTLAGSLGVRGLERWAGKGYRH